MEKQENKMGIMPIPKLIMTMSVPIMLSMLVQALYNVVDSVFVSRIGEDALTAVSLAFPVQNLMIAVGTGTAVGINALLSKSLGEGNTEEASSAANNGIFLGVLCALAFMVFGLFCSRSYFVMQTEPGMESIVSYGQDYLWIICVLSFGVFGQVILTKLLESTGLTVYSMIVQMIGAVINLILDPIMIFGLFGFPRMEVAGAALATVLGQIIATFVAIAINVKKNKEITLQWRGFRPKASTIRRIYNVGLPSIFMMSISSVMTLGMNRILMGFTSTAAAVFGVYFKLQSFIFMPVFGLNSGMIPVLAYNYGARRKDRMVASIRLSVIYALCIMTTGTIVFQIFPEALLRLFDATDEMVAIGIVAMRTISFSFIPAGYCIILGGAFQALGKGVFSLINSAARQLAVLLPLAYLLSLRGVLDLVWWAIPLAEIIAVVLSTVFILYTYRNIISPVAVDMDAA